MVYGSHGCLESFTCFNTQCRLKQFCTMHTASVQQCCLMAIIMEQWQKRVKTSVGALFNWKSKAKSEYAEKKHFAHHTALFAAILLYFAASPAASFSHLEITHTHWPTRAPTLTFVLLTLHWKLGSGTPSASQVRTLCLASSARCLDRLVITGFPDAKTLWCYSHILSHTNISGDVCKMLWPPSFTRKTAWMQVKAGCPYRFQLLNVV